MPLSHRLPHQHPVYTSILPHTRHMPCPSQYTLSVNQRFYCVTSYLTKNWVNCAVLTGNSAGLNCPFQSCFTQRTAHFTQGISQSPQFTCRHHEGHHLKAHPFLAIHSADEHRMIYSFSNTTSYSTFYVFFSSFRIPLWLMWLANSKRQPCFYPTYSHTQEDTQNWQKNWHTWWETCAVPENIQFSSSCSFFLNS
jgi:hypothetical protein